MLNNIFFPLKILPFYEVTCKSIVEPDRRQMTVWRMRIACWITKATNTHSEYVILIAFPLQQWLHERVSMLRYTYIACIVTTAIDPCSDLWKCMTCNLLKFKLQIISNKFFSNEE
jgi:hypothetical protein